MMPPLGADGMAGMGSMMTMPLQLWQQFLEMSAEAARLFWSYWGPLGEPMTMAVDYVVSMQRMFLQWLGELLGGSRAAR
jgi:hypothetical protein